MAAITDFQKTSLRMSKASLKNISLFDVDYFVNLLSLLLKGNCLLLGNKYVRGCQFAFQCATFLFVVLVVSVVAMKRIFGGKKMFFKRKRLLRKMPGCYLSTSALWRSDACLSVCVGKELFCALSLLFLPQKRSPK